MQSEGVCQQTEDLDAPERGRVKYKGSLQLNKTEPIS